MGELHPEDKALYDALCEELLSNEEDSTNEDTQESKTSKITTKVEALRSGNPSWSA